MVLPPYVFVFIISSVVTVQPEASDTIVNVIDEPWSKFSSIVVNINQILLS